MTIEQLLANNAPGPFYGPGITAEQWFVIIGSASLMLTFTITIVALLGWWLSGR